MDRNLTEVKTDSRCQTAQESDEYKQESRNSLFRKQILEFQDCLNKSHIAPHKATVQ